MTAIAEVGTKSSEPQPRGNLEVIRKSRQVKVESHRSLSATSLPRKTG